MIDKADAVVVGGGIMGASTAHFLTKMGYGKVVLLDQLRYASGATGYSAANVRQHYSNEVTIRLAVRAAGMFADAEQRLGGDVGFVNCGYMVIAPETAADAIRGVVPLQRELGVDARFLTREELAELYPQLDLGDIVLGCLERTSGYANPVRTVTTLVDAARELGLEAYENTPVTGIEIEDGRIAAVVTADGTIRTPVAVNAAGPWADRVGRLAGIDYKLRFSREHEVVLEIPEDLGPLPVVADATNRIFFRPAGPGRLLVGESYPKDLEPADPADYDDHADARVVERMIARLLDRVPSLRGVLSTERYRDRVLHSYSGIYSITDDWYPIVGGEPSIEGYYAAIGGSGHGFKIGPPIGESLAAVIAGEDPPVDISSLAHARFAEGRTFSSKWGSGNRG